ncbi:MAG: restriction endonuclease subunit S [Alphaproteobacteria bacterium]
MKSWSNRTLGEICTKITDGAHSSPKSVENGFPMASVKDLNHFGIDLHSARHISQADFDGLVLQGCRPQVGDVLIAKDGNSALDTVCVHRQDADVVLLSSVAILRPNEDHVLSDYLKYYFSNRATICYLKSNFISGAAIPRVVLKDFKRAKIKLPSVPEQTTIVSVLRSLDDKIELNCKTNETLESMAKAIFKDWFVDFGPTRRKADGATDPVKILGGLIEDPQRAASIADLFPPSFGDDGLPEGWGISKLSHWARDSKETVMPDEVAEETPYIGLEHMPRKSIALDKWESAGKVKSNKSRFFKGQILFGKLRPYFHKVGIAPIDGISSTDIVVIDAFHKAFVPYVATIVSLDEFVNFTSQTSTGTKMPRTKWSIMAEFDCINSGPDLTQIFCEIVAPMHDKIVSSIAENQTLAATRDLLLPKLMSGEISPNDLPQIGADL